MVIIIHLIDNAFAKLSKSYETDLLDVTCMDVRVLYSMVIILIHRYIKTNQ